MAVITDINKRSPFYGKLKNGDELISVNGKIIHDILDYMYYTASDKLEICVERDGKKLYFKAKTDYEDPMIIFDSFLMDKQRSCKNKCVFCFIDQLPANMRKTVYYKDDDFRLGMLQGNYVTFTNLTDEDVARICELKVSPLNVSVHATDGEARVRMMKNPNAANIMKLLTRFSDAGINLRCQIVLCKGFNDGEILERSLKDLKALYPAVSSVSIVPVGLSKFRDGLEPLELFNSEECKKVIEQVNKIGDECFEEYGTRIFYAADEFYVTASEPLPNDEFYGDFEQLDDGIGMLSLFNVEFDSALDETEICEKSAEISFVSGKITENYLPKHFKKLESKFPNLKYNLNFIVNHYFGENITVTGLVTGSDIIGQLKGKNLGEALFIPSVMLRDDKFLDDVSIADIEKALNVRVIPMMCGGAETVNSISDYLNNK